VACPVPSSAAAPDKVGIVVGLMDRMTAHYRRPDLFWKLIGSSPGRTRAIPEGSGPILPPSRLVKVRGRR
jgi:hypothetical protein